MNLGIEQHTKFLLTVVRQDIQSVTAKRTRLQNELAELGPLEEQLHNMEDWLVTHCANTVQLPSVDPGEGANKIVGVNQEDDEDETHPAWNEPAKRLDQQQDDRQPALAPVELEQQRQRYAAMTQGEAAADVLHTKGQLTTLQIVDEMLARGFVIEGPLEGRRDRLAASLFSLMRKRSARFRKVGPGRWELIEGTAAQQASTDNPTQ